MINLGNDERVLYEVRKHWYILLKDSLLAVVLFLVPWAVIFGLDVLRVGLTSHEGSLLFFFAMLWLFITWITFMIIWTNYYLDVWIITNKRLIDIEQFNLFKRELSEFRLDRVQDVTIEVKGLIPTLLHFGDVHVQTAGDARDFMIRGIPHPYKLRDILIREHDRFLDRGGNRSGVS